VVKSVTLRTDEARATLGVVESATDEEIRDAFLKQIKHAHPDRKSGTQSAFKQVKAAYDRLS